MSCSLPYSVDVNPMFLSRENKRIKSRLLSVDGTTPDGLPLRDRRLLTPTGRPVVDPSLTYDDQGHPLDSSPGWESSRLLLSEPTMTDVGVLFGNNSVSMS